MKTKWKVLHHSAYYLYSLFICVYDNRLHAKYIIFYQNWHCVVGLNKECNFTQKKYLAITKFLNYTASYAWMINDKTNACVQASLGIFKWAP